MATPVSYDELICGTYGFGPAEFPTKHNLIEALVERGEVSMEEVARQASDTRVVTHERVRHTTARI